jgi:uncharacterized OsmC-like protein
MNKPASDQTDSKPAALNGIQLSAIRETQERIRADGNGQIAKPEYKTSVVWNTAYQTSAQVKAGDVLIGDEPVIYGGNGKGATPQELLLAGIGNCLAATYIGGLSAQGVEVRSLRIDVSGRVNFRAAYSVEKGNPGFEGIEIQVYIDAGAADEKVNALLQKLLATAPIPDTIMRPVPLNVEIIHGSTPVLDKP